eukprot:m.149736 g.149736  ORF g.149736 m.149736 type:complete len:776 (+) comp38533_c0_seq4:128-2455(+)
MEGSRIAQNQLQFNLSAPHRNRSTASKPPKPGPIIIQCIDAPSLQSKRPNQIPPSASSSSINSMNFSVVSAERLQQAVVLARRTVRRGIAPPFQRVFPQTEPICESPEIPVQEDVGRPEPTASTLESRRRVLHPLRRQPRFAPEPLLAVKKAKARPVSKDLEATTKMRGDVKLTGDEKQAVEIYRLRQQLNEQLSRLNGIAISGGKTGKRVSALKESGGRQTIFDDHQDAASLRATIKAEEQAARSARMLYVLQRQVHEIQDELERREKQFLPVRHTKKSQTLSRLAAAHRAAVRTIQTFVHCAQPRGYASMTGMQRELGFLIRQLSACCLQMGIGGPEVAVEWAEIVKPGDEVKESGEKMKDNPVRISGEKEDEMIKIRKGQKALRKKRTKEKRTRNKKTIKSHFTSQTLASRLKRRQGEVGYKAGLKVPWKVPGARIKAQTLPGPSEVDFEFEDPVKEIASPRQKLSVRNQTKKKRLSEQKSKEKDHDHELLKNAFHEMMGKEVARQAWLDGETQRQLEEISALRKAEEARQTRVSESRKKKLSKTARQITDPQSITVRQQDEFGSSLLRFRLSEKALEAAASSADLVAERILNDLLVETAEEMTRIDNEGRLDRDTVLTLSAPTLETILQHLDAFEAEEEKIRSAWRTIKYEETGDLRVPDVASSSGYRFTSTPRVKRPLKHGPRSSSCEKHLLSVAEDERRRAIENQRAYEEYLRQGAARPLGCFDPEAMVEKISEGLLLDCLRDVASEIEQHCDDYVEDTVYSSEFAQQG